MSTKLPQFLIDVGIKEVVFKDHLEASTGYLTLKDDNGRWSKLVLSSKLSPLGMLVTLIHEYLHALCEKKMTEEYWITAQEHLLLDLLRIRLPLGEETHRNTGALIE